MIAASTQLISVRCPLSQSRVRHPGRGSACDHVQCFDAITFLQVCALMYVCLFVCM